MTLQLTVPKMACSACVNTITKAVKTIDPNATVQAEPQTKLVKIETQANETAIKQAMGDKPPPRANAAVGYPTT